MDDEMRYADDDRTITMRQIEEALTEAYGTSEYDRESGCYGGNREWLSINRVLSIISQAI